MARKSNKLAETYGKKSAVRKKKRSLKPKPTTETLTSNASGEQENIAAADSTSAPDPTPPPAEVRTVSRPSRAARTAEATYAYVISDMKRVGIIGAVLFVALIVLSVIL